MKTVNRCNIVVQKSQVISAAHRLLNHPGQCKNLHGHNYKITHHISGPMHDDTGMIIDFGIIKDLVCKAVELEFDHKTILQTGDPLIPVLKAYNDPARVMVFTNPPTAENMAMMILTNIQNVLPDNVFVIRVEVEETPGAVAVITANEIEQNGKLL